MNIERDGKVGCPLKLKMTIEAFISKLDVGTKLKLNRNQ